MKSHIQSQFLRRSFFVVAASCSWIGLGACAQTTVPVSGGGVVAVNYIDPFEGHQGLTGDYSVPVIADLVPFANYPMAKVCWFNSGSQAVIGYALPPELTGRPNSVISLTGLAPAQGAFQLKGNGDVANCNRDAASKSVECRVVYSKLTFDPVVREQILSTEFADPRELAGRLQVGVRFQGDPVGIIKFADQPTEIPLEDIPRWGQTTRP